MCLSGSLSFDAGPLLRATREQPGGDAGREFRRTRCWTRHASCLDREGGHLEEARKLLDPVIEQMMKAVHRPSLRGHNQVMGEEIMALFGAPLAHEDHAVRACYAALRMQLVVRRYSDELRRAQGIEARIRIGINSGEVVVRSTALRI